MDLKYSDGSMANNSFEFIFSSKDDGYLELVIQDEYGFSKRIEYTGKEALDVLKILARCIALRKENEG